MPTFHYKALNQNGETITGDIEAKDRKQVVQELRKEKCKPVRITVSSSSAPARENTSALSGSGNIVIDEPKQRRFKSKSADVLCVGFLKKVYQLHKSGMPIGDTIKNLSQRLTDPQLRELANKIWRDISEGKPLAIAMRQHPEVFDPSASYLIEAGEATGNLNPVLKDVIKQTESRIALRKKIIEGLSYPILLCTMALGVVALLLFFLMPKIESMMASMGNEELPLPARIVNAFSEFALTQGPFILIALIVGSISLLQWRKGDKGRLVTDGWLLRIPFVSGIILNLDICRMCNILPTLLLSGINATEALKLTGRSIQNKHISAKYQAARTMINDGATYIVAFRKNKFLTDMDLDILGVGENTGSPVEGLQEIFEQHNEELDQQFKNLTIIIAGAALGFAFLLIMMVVLSIVLTVLGVSQSIGG